MAEEKKPKIDLKARLGKAGTPPPAAVAPVAVPPQAAPTPAPSGGVRVPTPAPMQPGMAAGLVTGTAGPGVPVGPPPFAPAPIDTASPFAPVASPYRPVQPAPAAPPQPQRIEVDELAVQSAAKSARKQGVVIGLVFAVILGGVGYVAGGAVQQGADRTRSHNDAVELKTDAGKARDALKQLADMVQQGSDTILKEHKFPEKLSADLGTVNVDFDGSKLAGRRFSGFPAATAQDLLEFITAVQAINDRKILVQGLLNTLKKPIMDQFANAGQINVAQVVVVSKDPSNNFAGFLATMSKPITVSATSINLPPKLQFTDPFGGGNAEAPRYGGGDISKDKSALYIVPKSFDSVCPNAKAGQVTQLGAQMANFVHDINGDKAPAADEQIVQDSKPGLLERADRLMGELEKVSN
jgi:hypothetical protein